MIGMNRVTGAQLVGEEHLAQSVADILSTPIGTRVMRRDYGSLLPELIDWPFNALVRMLMHAATALALSKWEPRLQLRRVQIEPAPDSPGSIILAIEGDRTDLPGPNSFTRLTIPLPLAASAGAAFTPSSLLGA